MEIFIGVLAAWGAVMLAWTVLGLLLMPLTRRRDIRITAVVHGQGKDTFLVPYIRGLLWLRNLGLLWWDIAVVADQFAPGTVQQVEKFLEKESNAAAVTASELLDWMER